MGDLTQCPSCNRDYELPRRYSVNPADMEFLCVPRLLDCLDTCCQSCMEDSWQRSGNQKSITCPVCKRVKQVESTFFVPLNSISLHQILPADGVIPLTCSRCRDDVPSYSWCSSCSSSLCEFHHQDHKLSYNTARHDSQTLSELAHKKIKLIHKLPPIPCPHNTAKECTVFCHVCGYLVSPEVINVNKKLYL